MTSFAFQSLFAFAALSLLTACGGSVPPEQAGFTSTASVVAHSPAPVADCEAEGCNQPRIIDGLAEQYRFGAVQQPQQEEAVEPTVATEPLTEVAAASESAPAAPAQAL
ncbi:hypothetical protein [Massilia eurypsychrophila]|jgi:hypothetical protein|uniref:hypothetical protein n=1 Tax=Massilia eurypsychrophila TaxID=1485217 RepID=UPI00103381DB|nr:hypothetical protein [Massilia eurypsychrophila]